MEEERKILINNIKDLQTENSTYKDLDTHWSKNIVNWIKNYIDGRKLSYFKGIFLRNQFNLDELITKQEIAAVTIPY